jgi:enoyl-CoA hydratase
MCGAIDAALIAWRDDPAVAVVLIDGIGERAFCAGGDIAEVYRSGRAGTSTCRGGSGATNTA